MICSRCQKEIKDDSIFCPHCGLKLNKCPVCSQPLKQNAKFCSYCGTAINTNHQESRIEGKYIPISEIQQSLNEKDSGREGNYEEELHTSFKDVPVNKTVRKKPIIIAVCILLVLTSLSFLYLKYGPTVNIKESGSPEVKPKDIELSGKVQDVSYFGNTNQQGEVFYDEKNVYMIDENYHLIKMNKTFGNKQTIAKEASGNINVIENKIYYTDSKNTLCVVDNDGKNQQVVIAKAVYYVVFQDHKIYYQLDEDNESIHVYDLNTKEDKTINDRKSYNINVGDQKIYYSSTDGIYSISVDGSEDKKLSDVEDMPQLVYHEGFLYYKENTHISSYNVLTEDIFAIGKNDVYHFLNMNDQYIFYYSMKSNVVRYDRQKKESKVIYSGNVESLYIIGDKIILKTPTNNKIKSTKIVMGLDGENQRILFGSEGTFV